MASILYLLFFVFSFVSWVSSKTSNVDKSSSLAIKNLKASDFSKYLSIAIIELPQIILVLYWMSVLNLSQLLIATTSVFGMLEFVKSAILIFVIKGDIEPVLCDNVKSICNNINGILSLICIIGWFILYI